MNTTTKPPEVAENDTVPPHWRPPARIERALSDIFGEPVGQVEIVYQPAYVALHGRHAIATTRPNRIILAIPTDQFFANPTLMLHEYFHVLRQWNNGRLTRLRYLVELVRHGYHANRYEVEAREFAAAHVDRLRALLQATDSG